MGSYSSMWSVSNPFWTCLFRCRCPKASNITISISTMTVECFPAHYELITSEVFLVPPWTYQYCAEHPQLCSTFLHHAGTLPPVQKAAFSLFPSLVPLQPPELWPELLDSLVQLLKPHLLEGQQHQQLQQQLQQQLKQQRQGSFNARAPAAPSSNNNSLHRPALSSLSMERALEILLQLYK